MRSGKTSNSRDFKVIALAKVDEPIESMPDAPFGALVVAHAKAIPFKDYAAIAERLLKAGCMWATLHVHEGRGKDLERLHAVFDKAIVEYQLSHDPDADMMTSGEGEDSLREAVRDAVWDAQPTYGDPFKGLLALVVGPDAEQTAESVESLAKSVEAE